MFVQMKMLLFQPRFLQIKILYRLVFNSDVLVFDSQDVLGVKKLTAAMSGCLRCVLRGDSQDVILENYFDPE